jgi:hypothetical protein
MRSAKCGDFRGRSHGRDGAAGHDVYLSMVDGDHDDGWVARLSLDAEAARELRKAVRTRVQT